MGRNQAKNGFYFFKYFLRRVYIQNIVNVSVSHFSPNHHNVADRDTEAVIRRPENWCPALPVPLL